MNEVEKLKQAYKDFHTGYKFKEGMVVVWKPSLYDEDYYEIYNKFPVGSPPVKFIILNINDWGECFLGYYDAVDHKFCRMSTLRFSLMPYEEKSE